MSARRSLGRRFGWLWAAYAVSAYGSGLGFGAFPLIAVLVLHASPAQVSALSAVGPAVGALIALPLGPWVEFRRKRPVMIAMDLARFAALLTIPVAYALGRLSFVQLLVVSAVVAAAKIAFNAASGAYLKALVRPDDLLVANARFESTTWSSIAVGPPLGGAAIGLFGPVATVVADALSYLLSALGITAIRGREEPPAAHRRRPGPGRRAARRLAAHPDPPRPAGALPQPAARRRTDHGHRAAAGRAPARRARASRPGSTASPSPRPASAGSSARGWPAGSWPATASTGSSAPSGTLRAVWLIGLAFVRPGVVGLATVIAVEFAIIISMSLYNPVLATYRLEHTPTDRVARTLSAWSIGSSAAIAVLTALGGLLAARHQPAHGASRSPGC